MPVVGELKENEAPPYPDYQLNRKSGATKSMEHEKTLSECMSYLGQGYTLMEVARMMQKNPGYIYRCIQTVKKRMRKCQMVNLDDHLNLRRMQYERVLVQMWEAWEASKKDHKGNPRAPDVQYIDRILATLAAIRKMDGIDKQADVNPADNPRKGFDWDSLTQGHQLTSMTVTLDADKQLVSEQKHREDLLKDELEQRIQELEMRARNKQDEERVQDDKKVIRAQVTHANGRKTTRVVVVKPKTVPDLGDE